VRIDDLDSSPEARDSFCSSLRQYSFAIVQLNPQSSAAWHGFHSELHQFFALTKDEKEALGPFRRIGGRMFGYRMDEGEREFVEIRRAPTKKTGVAPAMAEGTGAAQAWDTGCHVARTLLRVLSEEGGLSTEVMMPLVDTPPDGQRGGQGEEGEDDGRIIGISDGVLRSCQYVGAAPEAGSAERPILFGAHTDTTFLTVNPVCGRREEAGLECKNEETGEWVDVEAILCEHQAGGEENVVVVQVGEYVQLLSCNAYKACEHRVRACEAGKYRVSCPYLQRGRRDAVLDTTNLSVNAAKTFHLPDPMTLGGVHQILEQRRRAQYRLNEQASPEKPSESTGDETVIEGSA